MDKTPGQLLFDQLIPHITSSKFEKGSEMIWLRIKIPTGLEVPKITIINYFGGDVIIENLSEPDVEYLYYLKGTIKELFLSNYIVEKIAQRRGRL